MRGKIVPCNIDSNDYNDFKSLGIEKKVGCKNAFSHAKILLVEDDSLMRTFTLRLLTRLGIGHLKECTDSTAAVSEVSKFQPDLIVTEVHTKQL